MEKPGIAGDNRPQPVGCRWTTRCTACGSPRCPQSVEILRPRIHMPLSWSDGPSTAASVDTVWTTSQSPGCGREKVAESVESGRNPAGIRTAGDREMTKAGRDMTEGAPGRPAPGGALGVVRAAASAVLDAVGQLGDLVVDRAALGHQIADLAVGVHDRRVVTAAEERADLRQ
ncbi:hypothetical protein SAFG77S_01381 [Streptomyces afghaniensis]